MNSLILVAGATGGVGQLTAGKLLQEGFQVRVLTRNQDKAAKMFDRRVEIAIADLRDPSTLPPVMENVTHIISCTGTTAFPSSRWNFESTNLLEWLKIYSNKKYALSVAKNSPEIVDGRGTINLVKSAPGDLKRFIYISSVGVGSSDQLPFKILNAFGVLDAKKKGEEAVINSNLPYTIIRPSRLIDGPYTSYDLNTLLQAKTKGKLGVVIAPGDKLFGQTSRIDVATACVKCLSIPATANKAFAIINQGKRPEAIAWSELLTKI